MDPFLSYDLYFLVQAAILLLFLLATFVQLISALDDLFLDLAALACKCGLRSTSNCGTHNLITLLESGKPEKPVAIMIPAWKEAAVIRSSVEHLLKYVAYRNYRIFIGCYPNDPDTIRVVSALAKSHDRVEMVVLPHDGGTSKADCLNHIASAIHKSNKARAHPFEALILQDAEDVVHSHSLRVFNYFLDEHDVVQLPVVALPRAWHDPTTGHYQDEFAEMHGKELLVRAAFSGLVPGAGVGTAYSASILEKIRTKGDIFRTDALTEDYDLSFRLHRIGARFCFPQVHDGQRSGLGTRRDLVATREYFPHRFSKAVRQKTRWTLGIGFQGWSRLGWHGSPWLRYLLWRDRKTLFSGHAAVISYTVLAFLLLQPLLHAHLSFTPHPILPPGHVLWLLPLANIGFFVYRLAHRHFWTWRLYGWTALPMLLPRYFWSVAINYCALARANWQLWAAVFLGRPLAWEKTDHSFPDPSDLDDDEPPPDDRGKGS
ncbi:glycosyltransferase [Fodinicurvata halophila]|uniref:Glycosyltransferase n=1 Tax=Fodinicurvata halophila TaxID=1419723 RepID=A0ABV8UJS8_9PROT